MAAIEVWVHALAGMATASAYAVVPSTLPPPPHVAVPAAPFCPGPPPTAAPPPFISRDNLGFMCSNLIISGGLEFPFDPGGVYSLMARSSPTPPPQRSHACRRA